ncbi:MAG: bile acid:sodium symporter [Deltaproteobacteria bacterium]|nr:bile acid:sodium symporter [Deltaproteobacteria bacterium]
MRSVKALEYVKKRWFLFGLLLVCMITLIDESETVASLGKWCKGQGGGNAVIFLIFFASGLILNNEQISKGLGDLQGTALALVLIFVIAPIVAYALNALPMDREARIGLFLVAVTPTTMTSGVVMTGAAGGNMAHALLITVLANGMSLLTIPLSLSVLLGIGGEGGAVSIEKGKMMVQIGFLVLVPLVIGMMLRPKRPGLVGRLRKGIPVFTQSMILAIVWMGLSGARAAVLSGGGRTFQVVVFAFLFHALLLVVAFVLVKLLRIGVGRRESVIFMGGQKTLPLSVLLQTTLFPEYGLALAFCVIHHFVHLMMDGYLVHRLGR